MPTVSLSPLPFLPEDNYPLENEVSHKAVKYSSEAVGGLLRLDDTTFWRHVAHDDALSVFLDTYLRHALRTHDDLPTAVVNKAASASADISEARKNPSLLLPSLILSPGRYLPLVISRDLFLSHIYLSLADRRPLFSSSSSSPPPIIIPVTSLCSFPAASSDCSCASPPPPSPVAPASSPRPSPTRVS